MIRRILILLFACATFAAAPLRAADPPAPSERQVVALLRFESVGASDIEISAATDRMQEELLATRRFVIMDRAQVDSVLKEQALQPSGCVGNDCTVKVGKVLGARRVVSGKVTRLGDSQWLVSASIVDVESGQTEHATSIQFEGAYIVLLRDGMPILAAKLAGTKTPETPGFAAKVVDFVTSPIPSPMPSPADTSAAKPGPKPGFALYLGGQSIGGAVKLMDGQSLGYSSNQVLIGVDYQWLLTGFFTIAAFFEVGVGDAEGQIAKVYSNTDSGGLGVEIRYWRSPWYYTGSLGGYTTSFFNKNDAGDRIGKSELMARGASLGLGLGYEWDRWYLNGALDIINMSAEPPTDPTFPQAKSAQENRVRVRVGYRWKKD